MRQACGRPILVHADKTAALETVALDEKAISEKWLQALIHNHPACLPVSEIEPGFGDLVGVCMELPTKHGPIDNLLMTPDGDLVLVETKLWRNQEARRQVVAQALDYASCLFELDYEELEKAVLKASFGDRPRPAQLYELFAEKDAKAEPAFIDAVNTNLRKGRVLILVVGDGIRTEAKRLASILESHAGAHFTFGLVELNVFRLGGNGGFIVCPRTLVQTEMISRGIVEIHDNRTIVLSPKTGAGSSSGESKPRAETITAEHFFEAMAAIRPDLPDRLRAFIAALEPLGVYPDFQRSLNLRWDPPTGKPINLGYVMRTGQVWTDTVNANAPEDLSHLYIQELATAFVMEVKKDAFKGAWHVRTKEHAPRIAELVDKLDAWVPVIERFLDRVRERLTAGDA